ncbi:MAG TPA: hypothetical protein PKA58_24000 [Polyangium sp.]|nr:hypothetical protein [Polyangium sp.]
MSTFLTITNLQIRKILGYDSSARHDDRRTASTIHAFVKGKLG